MADAVKLVTGMRDLEPFPVVAAQVMTLATDPGARFYDLAQVVSTDQALTAKLLGASNSAGSASRYRCVSVPDAIRVLGMQEVWRIAVGASVMGMFGDRRSSNAAFDEDLFWVHSLTVAIAAERVARSTGLASPEQAFTAGILHDVGRLVLRQRLPENFSKACELALAGEMPLDDAEAEELGYAHAEVGGAVAARWGLPTHLVNAISHHHYPDLSPEADGLSGIVAQSDRLVLHMGVTCGVTSREPTEPLPEDLERLAEAIGGVDTVLGQAYGFMEKTVGPPAHWYTQLEN